MRQCRSRRADRASGRVLSDRSQPSLRAPHIRRGATLALLTKLAVDDMTPLSGRHLCAWEAETHRSFRRCTARCRKGSNMDAITTDFGEVLLWSFWLFI